MNLICYRKNKLMSVFNASVLLMIQPRSSISKGKALGMRLVNDHEFRHNIIKVVCGSTRLSLRGSTATLTM